MKNSILKLISAIFILLLISSNGYALNKVSLSTGYFANPTSSKSIANGRIYVGKPDLDPVITANQKQISVLQENGTIVAISQPISTSMGGVPVYNGSPVTILVDGAYSIAVYSSSGSQIYYISQNDIIESLNSIDSVSALKAIAYTPIANQVIYLDGYYAIGDGGGGQMYWDATSTETDNGGTIFKVAGIDTGRWKRPDTDEIYSSWFGGIFNDSDISANLNAAASFCFLNNKTLILPPGSAKSSITLDWSAYLTLRVKGSGQYATSITFTDDTDGIIFGGRYIGGFGVYGIGKATATGTGIRFVSSQRKQAYQLLSQGWYDGMVYDIGNYSQFNYIFCVSNGNDGFVMSDATVDGNGCTFGMMDLRGNGRDGFHLNESAVADIWECQQATSYGSMNTFLNGRYGVYIGGGRGSSFKIYSEANTIGDLYMGTSSEGTSVEILFSDSGITNLGSGNEIKNHRQLSSELIQYNNLRSEQLQVTLGNPYIGIKTEKQTANYTFTDTISGTSSSTYVTHTDQNTPVNRMDIFAGKLVAQQGLNFGTNPGTSPGIYYGADAPEGVISAYRGSLYLRTGLDSNCLYVKEVGAYGNTGWVLK
jgi:hypothetical protein